VESESSHLLWDGTIVAHSKKNVTDTERYAIIDGYKVKYKKWSSLFVEWVKPSRILEPSDHNRSLQVIILPSCFETLLDPFLTVSLSSCRRNCLTNEPKLHLACQ
jgi:hypothetical protein